MMIPKGRWSTVLAVFTVVAIAAILLLQNRAQTALRLENLALRDQVASLRAENEEIRERQLRPAAAAPGDSQRLRELLKLRNEVSMLRRQQREAQNRNPSKPPLRQADGSDARADGHPLQPAPFQLQLVTEGSDENSETLTNSAGNETLHVRKSPLLDFTAISAATVFTNPSTGNPEIEIQFSDVGRELFAQVTKENLNRRLAIVLGGQLYSAPVIRSEITGGKAQITGSFTPEQARELAAKINHAVSGE